MIRPLAAILCAASLARAAYVSAAADPAVSFVPDCALWSTRDGGCFATPDEFVHGRDANFSQHARDAGGSP